MEKIARSITLDVPPAAVWARIGPFGSLADWHPTVARCTVSEKDGQTVRRLESPTGAVQEHQLDGHDEAGRWYTFRKDVCPHTRGYRARLSVTEEGSRARVEFSAEYEPASQALSEDMVRGIVDAFLWTPLREMPKLFAPPQEEDKGGEMELEDVYDAISDLAAIAETSPAAFRARLIEILSETGKMNLGDAPDLDDAALADKPGYTLIAIALDYEFGIWMYAVPNAKITEADRALLEQARGTDYTPGQCGQSDLGIALRILAATGHDGNADALEEEWRDEVDAYDDPDDWNGLMAGAGRWSDYFVGSTGEGFTDPEVLTRRFTHTAVIARGQ